MRPPPREEGRIKTQGTGSRERGSASVRVRTNFIHAVGPQIQKFSGSASAIGRVHSPRMSGPHSPTSSVGSNLMCGSSDRGRLLSRVSRRRKVSKRLLYMASKFLSPSVSASFLLFCCLIPRNVGAKFPGYNGGNKCRRGRENLHFFDRKISLFISETIRIRPIRIDNTKSDNRESFSIILSDRGMRGRKFSRGYLIEHQRSNLAC